MCHPVASEPQPSPLSKAPRDDGGGGRLLRAHVSLRNSSERRGRALFWWPARAFHYCLVRSAEGGQHGNTKRINPSSTKGHEVTPDHPVVCPGSELANGPIVQHKSAFSRTFNQF